jgi:hypothetical protein
VRPDAHEHDPEERPAAIGEPFHGRRARAGEHRVQDPFALQHPFPDQRDHYWRQQDGIEEHAAPESASGHLAVQHQRGDQREQHHQADLKHRELGGVVDRTPEQVLVARRRIEVVRALEQRLEVLDPDVGTLRRIQLHAAGEREIEIDDDRQEREQPEDHQVRRHEHPADARHAEEALQRAHRRIDDVERRAAGARRDVTHGLERAFHGTRPPAPRRRNGPCGLLLGGLHLLVDVAEMRFNASSSDISPTIAWPSRAAVGLKIARLYL